MASKVNYNYWGVLKDGTKFNGNYYTKSRRQTKVLKQIEQDLFNRKGITFMDLEDFGFNIQQ